MNEAIEEAIEFLEEQIAKELDTFKGYEHLSNIKNLNSTVEKLKAAHKDGKLTQEEIEDLGDALLDITESKLADSVKGLLVGAKIDLENLIRSTAESYIDKMKGWEV